jgi:hypothetical protein
LAIPFGFTRLAIANNPARVCALQSMDKKRKTRWERKIRRMQIALVVFLPVIFGVAYWFISRMKNTVGP